VKEFFNRLMNSRQYAVAISLGDSGCNPYSTPRAGVKVNRWSTSPRLWREFVASRCDLMPQNFPRIAGTVADLRPVHRGFIAAL
jgi:hypothetical protein